MRKRKRHDPCGKGARRPPSDCIEELEALNAELRATEQKLRLLLQHAPNAMCLCNIEGAFIEGNTAVEVITGYPRDEFIGRSLLELSLISSDDRSRAAALLAKNVAGQSTGPDEFVLENRAGIRTTVEIYTRPVSIGGEPLVLVIAHDITARREVEERVQLLSAIAEQSPIAVGIADKDGIIEYANPTLLEIYGAPVEEVRGKHWMHYVSSSPGIRDQVQELQDVVDRGGTWRAVVQDTDRDGNLVWRRTIVFPVIGVRGETTHLVHIGEDVTAQIQAEQALKASEAQYSALVEGTTDGIAIIQDGLLRFVNAASLELLGYPPEELVGTPFIQYVTSELREFTMKRFTDRIAGKDVPGFYELELLKRDGTLLPVEVNASRFTYQGRVAVLAYLRDITKRKQAEEELRTSEAQLSNALRMAHAGHWEYDVDTDTFTFNDNFFRIFRTTAEEVGGYTLSSAEYARRFCHPDDMHMVREEVQAAIATDDPYYSRELEHRILYANGEVGHIAVRFFIVKDSHGRTVRTYGVNQDITERRQAEQRVRKALEGTIQAVAETIETRDPYTAGHQRRVTRLAVAIAQHLNLPSEQVRSVRVAATLHDIGKMSTPSEILSKPGKLSSSELALIRQHPTVAHSILKGIVFPWPVAEIILQHHERLDGSGYPEGLANNSIRLEARIIAVADVVEAMSGHRPYRPARGITAALQEIEQNKGILYDPEVVDACIALFRAGNFAWDE